MDHNWTLNMDHNNWTWNTSQRINAYSFTFILTHLNLDFKIHAPSAKSYPSTHRPHWHLPVSPPTHVSSSTKPEAKHNPTASPAKTHPVSNTWLDLLHVHNRNIHSVGALDRLELLRWLWALDWMSRMKGFRFCIRRTLLGHIVVGDRRLLAGGMQRV